MLSDERGRDSTAVYQRARATLKIGRRSRLSAGVKVTSGGLLAIAALTSAILLSTAVLVRTAVASANRRQRPNG